MSKALHDIRFWIGFFLFLVILMGVSNLVATYIEVNDTKAHFAAEQREQRAAGRIIEEKLCASFGKLAALKPPAVGNASANPSRAYDQQQHDILAGVGPDIGCTIRP